MKHFPLLALSLVLASAPFQPAPASPQGSKGTDKPAPQDAGQKPPAPAAGEEKKPMEDIVMPTLWVGDDAPAFSIAKWVHGTGVEKLERGKTYLVVVLGPDPTNLDDSLGRLTELQKKHAGKLTVLATLSDSVSSPGSGLAIAEAYAKEHGAQMGFAFGYEKESGLKKGWIDASRQGPPPASFLVNAKGKLAWIGMLEDLEPTLGEVLAGKQDLKKAAETYRKDFTYLLRSRKHTMGFELSVDLESWERAVQHADALLALDPETYVQYGAARFILTATKLKKLDEAYAFAKTFIEGPAKDNAEVLNGIAWNIVDPDNDLERRDLEIALKAASRGVELTERKEVNVLDTLAVVHLLRDELETALTVARECAKLDKRFEDRVKQVEAEIEARKGKK